MSSAARTELPWKGRLRAVGLTELAKGPNPPRHMPKAGYGVYTKNNNEYRTMKGNRPYGNAPETADIERAKNILDETIKRITGSLGPVTGIRITQDDYDSLVTSGENVAWHGRSTYGPELVKGYRELVETVLLDIRASSWEGAMVKETLVAYWLKALELERMLDVNGMVDALDLGDD